MPEKPPENLENIKKSKKPIGEGYEKVVYSDTNNENRVVAKFKEHVKETPNQIKARYYLTKILHLLFPENIPDMHWAGSEPHAYQVDKVETDERHKEIQKYSDMLRAGEAPWQKDEKTHEEAAEKNWEMSSAVVSDKDVSAFRKKIEQLDIRSLDKSAGNYTKDSEGNVQYLDSFYAWKFRYDGTPYLFFDFEKLEEAINSLPDNDKKTALNFLQRLRWLYEDERDKNKNKDKETR